MDEKQVKHSLMMLRDDLDRESIKLLKNELEQIVKIQQDSIDQHGKFLTTTREDELPKLKAAAVLNKARKEAAEHLLAFFNLKYLNNAINQLTESIREKETNE